MPSYSVDKNGKRTVNARTKAPCAAYAVPLPPVEMPDEASEAAPKAAGEPKNPPAKPAAEKAAKEPTNDTGAD